jgi:SAM-dependent methyltransferase
VNAEIARRLLDLNCQFYQTFALQFSATRQRIQPGIRRILGTLSPEGDILDLGCGNGELARELARRRWAGRYVGMDFSPGLLDVAQDAILPDNFHFIQTDISSPEWDFEIRESRFEIVLAFALLHHIPGEALRRRLLGQVRGLLALEGQFIHSEWQFLNSSRLATRIQPWDSIGLTKADVDPGDYLMDWRHGGLGLRYVHHFSENELASLAVETGFTVAKTLYSDGERGRLGLYQVWKLRSP